MKINWNLVVGYGVLFLVIFRWSMFLAGGVVGTVSGIETEFCMTTPEFLLTVSWNMALAVIGFYYGVEMLKKELKKK